MPPLRPLIAPAGLCLLAMLTLGFAIYAIRLGAGALLIDPQTLGRLYSQSYSVANIGLALHMLTGALITVLLPLQLISAIRRRWPLVHRLSGRFLVCLSASTALAGLVYILLNGTIGGPLMSLGFALYGALMCVAAAQTWRCGHSKDFARHRRWALRLFVLAIGSWLFRVHYGLWYVLTDGAASNLEFTGLFDRIQVFTFYVPYLLLLEIWLRFEKRPRA